MRKRTVNCLFDNIMWYALYLLPLICFVVVLYKTGEFVALADCMSSCGFGILTDNLIYTCLSSLFGASGVMPLFVSADILLYFSYFISIWLCHIAVDVLLFLVRYAHHLMDSFGGSHD